MGIADCFLYLRDGRIAAEYTPEDLLLLPEADILGMGLRSPHEDFPPNKKMAWEISCAARAVLGTKGGLCGYKRQENRDWPLRQWATAPDFWPIWEESRLKIKGPRR